MQRSEASLEFPFARTFGFDKPEAVCQVPNFVFPPIGEQLIVHSVLLT
jgi:hypothetical protein